MEYYYKILIDIYSRDNDTFVIGSSDFLTLEILVENRGENAYITKLEVNLPEELQFIEDTSKCKFPRNKSQAICQVDNPLRQYARVRKNQYTIISSVCFLFIYWSNG